MAHRNNDKEDGDVKNGENIRDAGNTLANEINGVLNTNVPNRQPTVETFEIEPPRQLHLTKRNRCYVVSNRFENQPSVSLPQYAEDEKKIIETFSWLNFDITLKQDISSSKIKKFVNEMSETDYSDEQCLILFILSHGNDKGEIIGTDNIVIKISWIVNKLQGIATLRGKPKLVFIQACRGKEATRVVNETRTAGAQPKKKAEKADTFVYYSTTEGTKAWLNPSGSFFITNLCKVLRGYYGSASKKPRYHFSDVIIKVNDLVSTYVRKGTDGKEYVQVSEACSSLTQHLYFCPKKNLVD